MRDGMHKTSRPGASDIGDLGVGSIPVNYIPVNIGGAFASSAGQVARAGVMQGTSYVMGGSNSALYGVVAQYAGLGAGGLLYNTYDGPFRLVATARTNSEGNRAIAIGAGVSGTSPVLDVLSVGYWDTGGPAWYDLYKFKGNGLVQTDNITSEYMVDGGKMRWDGTNGRMTTGFKDPDDDTVHAEWTDETGASSVAKSSGVTTITVANGTRSDWPPGGAYNAARLEAQSLLPRYSDWEIWVHKTDDNVNDQGGFLGVLFSDTDANFVAIQSVKSAGNNLILAYQGGNGAPLYNAAVGATATWLKLAFSGNLVRFFYFNAAIGSEPTDSQWVQVATHTLSTAAGWTPSRLTAMVGAMNIASDPGCSIDFGRVTIKYN